MSPLNRAARSLIRAAATAGLLALALAAQARTHTNRIMVQVAPGGNIQAIAAAVGAEVDGSLPQAYLYVLRLSAKSNATAVCAALNNSPQVSYAEPDGDIALDDVGGDQHHFAFDAGSDSTEYENQLAYEQIDMCEPLDAPWGKGVTVAVLDTGAQLDHPALLGHIKPGLNTIKRGQLPVEVADGVHNRAMGHGTFIAGLIAHVAPHARVMVVRVLNADGEGSLFHVVEGVYYAVTHGARVINMSFGTEERSLSLDIALRWARACGCVLVAAAGNLAQQEPHFPAASAGVLGVASVDASNIKSDFSNYGRWVRLAAPGDGLRSAYWDWTHGRAYATGSGTSFAAPLVAAEAALLLAHKPHETGLWIETIILKSAHRLDDLNPVYSLGAGLIDVAAALEEADDNI